MTFSRLTAAFTCVYFVSACATRAALGVERAEKADEK
jgi:hypothetical protein